MVRHQRRHAESVDRCGTAARRIVRALCHGEAELMVSLPARLAVSFHGLFPGITADFNSLLNRLLPGPGGIGQAQLPGHLSQSAFVPSVLPRLNERQAVKNNERA